MARKRELEERLTKTEDALGKTEAALDSMIDNYQLVKESLVDIEMARDRAGWMKLGAFNRQEFSKDFLNQIYSDAVTSYIKNPITKNGVNVKGNYVFGQGLTITGESDEVDKLWQLFWNHPANRAEFTTPEALFLKEVDLELEGNLFLALFTAPSTGAVKIRSIISSEIVDIITNPGDAKEPWFYHREWSERRMSDNGMWQDSKPQKALYPAWNFRPKSKPPMMWGIEVMWNSPIYHVKVGGTSHMRFGVSEPFASLDWSKAYKEAMEDYATVRSSHVRFAWQTTVKGGATGVAAMKAKLGTTYGSASTDSETNPSPVAGATAISAEGMAQLQVMRTAGAQSAPEEARMLMVMAAAGFGLPYSILSGDADKSNLATAKSLDRPTELGMQMRRMVWTTIFTDINTYLLRASVGAPNGVVKGKITTDEWGAETVDLSKDSDGEPIPTGITVNWPPILEHDAAETVKAIVMAATLDGKPDAGVFDIETIIRLLGNAVGVDNINTVIDDMLARADEAPPAESTAEEAAFVEVLKEVARVLREEQENGDNQA